MPALGWPELLILLAIVALIFGVGRLPEIGGAIGKSIRDFKSSIRPDDAEQDVAADSNDQAKPAI
jgi:sec-independent protein translocase protein TatA